MNAEIEALRAAGFLSALDEHFARAMARIGGEHRPEVLLAAALVSRQVSNGQVCLDLGRVPEAVDEQGKAIDGSAWPESHVWRRAIESSPLVARAERESVPERPLVLDAAGRLYLTRYWEHEDRLARALASRATQTDGGIDAAILRRGLERLFPPRPGAKAGEPDLQRLAAAVAISRRFAVISGGPGTGKTYTVVKILALLIEQALRAGRRPPRIHLVAPTGKAAARLSESIRNATRGLDCDPDVREAIPEEASTIHRCLGAFRGSDTSFRHHGGNPLVTDLVLVDEASMVDLALMSRLIDALPADARLILLGDKDQLSSVEAGAVLGDICNSGERRAYSSEFVESLAALGGGRLPLEGGAAEESGIGDAIVVLTRSYRYGPESGIGRLAEAINAGDAEEALHLLDSPQCDDVALVPPPREGGLGKVLRDDVVRGYADFLAEGAGAEARLQAFERFRVLAAHRRGPFGVETVNREIEEALAAADFINPRGVSYHGRPVLVTRNDYQLALFNGDIGVILDDHEGRAAHFIGTGGRLRRLSPSRLPPHETAFALTVHRSQGSEFDEVAVLLPDRPSPVVTRELLYTAVTRAKRKVTIHATPEIVAHAVATRTERASGLRAALWG
jgi:exodeoxyribonuclease V alpha subunit